MSTVTPCVDHDRNLAFNRPADWGVTVETGGRGPAYLSVVSPPAPDGSPGVWVAVLAEWHEMAELDAFVDWKFSTKTVPYTLRGRSAGRHPVNGSPAISVTYDETGPDGRPQRVESIYVEVRPGVVISALAMCPLATRHLWRAGCKLIFGSLRLADPARPPVTGSEGVLGLGLPPGCSEAMKRLWRLLDLSAKLLVDHCGADLEARTGKSLGVAAHFEARVYLFFELIVTMGRARYPTSQREAVQAACTHAITGGYPADPPPGSLLERQVERLFAYHAVHGDSHPTFSTDRTKIFSELLTTVGMGSRPAAINSGRTLKCYQTFTPEKEAVLGPALLLIPRFIFAAVHLFTATPDINVLTATEVDRRFAAGNIDAERTLEQVDAAKASADH